MSRVVRPIVDAATVVVGHSGSGVVLPLLSQGAAGVVFVDAVIPAISGETMPSEQIRAFVAGLAADGRLPVWTEWFAGDEFGVQVTKAVAWQAIVSEQPHLPADFYEYAVPVPADWDQAFLPSYLRFSPAYDDHVAEARSRGWTVSEMQGTHLAQADRPEDVAAALRSIVA